MNSNGTSKKSTADKKKHLKKKKLRKGGGSYDLGQDEGQHKWTDLNDGIFSIDLDLFQVSDEKLHDGSAGTLSPLQQTLGSAWPTSTDCEPRERTEVSPPGQVGAKVLSAGEELSGSGQQVSSLDQSGMVGGVLGCSMTPLSGVTSYITQNGDAGVMNKKNYGDSGADVNEEKINFEQTITEDNRIWCRNGTVWAGCDYIPTIPSTHSKLSVQNTHENSGKYERSKHDLKTRDDVKQESGTPGLNGDGDGRRQLHAATDRVSSEPLWICKMMMKWPVTVFLALLTIHTSFFIATAALYFTDFNIFPSDFRTIPISLHHDDSYLRALAWNRRYLGPADSVQRFVVDQYKDQPAWIRGFLKETVELFYESKNGNVLTPEDLWMIRDIEDTLLNLTRFRDDFCQLTAYNECVKPLSILRFFDGTYSSVNATFKDENFTNIVKVLERAQSYPETKDTLMNHLAIDSVVKDGVAVSDVTRSFIFFGWPLGVVESNSVMTGKIDKYMDTEFKQTIQMLQAKYKGRIGFYFYHERLYFDDVQAQAFEDIYLAYGSLAFILCFILLHTRSLWISFWAVYSMGGCFFATNLIYRYILGFSYFGFLHILSVFIILGIGADDIFIFYDLWRASGDTQYSSLLHRFSHCYRRSAGAMFATSLTTMVAFFLSGISPLLMVQSFGLFTGFLVLTNYISVITFFPSVIIVYHLKIKKCLKRFCKCCCRRNVYNIQDDSNTKYHDNASHVCDKIKRSCDNYTDCHDNRPVCHDNIKSDLDIKKYCEKSIGVCNLQEINYDNHYETSTKQSPANGGVVNPGFECDVFSAHDVSVSVQKPETKTDTATDNTQKRVGAHCNETTVIGENVLGYCKSLNGHIPKGAETSNEKCQDYYQLCGCRWKRQKHFLIRFFEGPFYWLISHRVLRWFILVGFAVMVATFSYFCTKIVPDEEEIQAYNPQSNYGKSTRMRLYSFKLTERDQMLRMYIIWGLKKQNVSSCDYRNIQNVTNCRGQTTFDEDFDINKPGGQLAMAGLCERLYNLSRERLEELKIKIDETTGDPMINCFMHDIKRYFEDVSKKLVSSPTRITTVSPAQPLNFSIPFDEKQMIEVMKLHSAIYQLSRIPDNFTNWFEIALGYWMTNMMTLKITDDYKVYNPILGEKKTPDTQRTQGIDIFYGTKMHFAAVVISTSINARALGYTTGLPLFEKWEQLVSELREDLPEGVNNCFLATPEINIYHWLRVQQSLSHQAIMGLGLGIALAFPVLVLGTQNIIVGVLATLSISLSTICVVGIISVAGWELGVLESVNLCLVVGLSIDYEVHLAEGYYYSTKTCRRKRVKQLLGEVGISVLSGAMTTLGAATFMLFAELQFYLQFGVFMFCTIGFSILFGLAFFTTALALLGPQNDCGSLSPIWKKMKSCCGVTCQKKEN